MRTTRLTLPEAAQALAERWDAARGDAALPERRALDPVSLWRWLGDLTLVELRPGPKRFFIRLQGARTARNVGRAFDKQFLEDCAPEHAREAAIKPYEVSLQERLPVFSRVFPGILTGCFQSFDRLVMPMRANSAPGETPTDSVAFFLTWLGPTYLDDEPGQCVYGEHPPSDFDREEAERRMGLSVIDPGERRDTDDAARRVADGRLLG